jgi:hypothetical protein
MKEVVFGNAHSKWSYSSDSDLNSYCSYSAKKHAVILKEITHTIISNFANTQIHIKYRTLH